MAHRALPAYVGLLSAITFGTAAAQNKTVPVFTNGEAQVVPGFEDPSQWIRQTLWVETEFDSDNDGKRDRVHVDVTRPAQTDTEGLKVPVIYESSPYYPMSMEFLPWNVEHDVGTTPPARAPRPDVPLELPPDGSEQPMISESEVSTWLPRGFAVVHSESPGTGLSQGCPTVGGTNESLAPKAVIDWLNGRARGYTTATGTDTVSASWSTGKVGMTGTSYNGTLTLAAATTGVPGLEAIIPVAPVSSFYEYYRANGLVRHPGGYLGEDVDVLYDFINAGLPDHREYCNTTIRGGEMAKGQDRVTGDYNDFWMVRDYLTNASKVKAALLMSHGFNDWNVMPDQSARFYEAVKKQGVPAQAYYHQGAHGGPPPLEQMNRWFTRYLFGEQNGVEKDPRAWIVREGDDPSSPTPYADFPNPEATAVTLHPMAGGANAGSLSLAAKAGQGKEKLVDDVSVSGKELAEAKGSNHRLLYATPVLTEPVHISGWTNIALRLAASKPAANLSVWLVELSPKADSSFSASIITRGWADPQNHKAPHAKGEPLVPGQFYDMTLKLEPDDQIVPAGKRIGLMIFSSDKDFTLWPAAGTELTVDLDGTTIALPVVGGAAALKRALGTP